MKFNYRARNQWGAERFGTIEGNSVADAKRRLVYRGFEEPEVFEITRPPDPRNEPNEIPEPRPLREGYSQSRTDLLLALANGLKRGGSVETTLDEMRPLEKWWSGSRIRTASRKVQRASAEADRLELALEALGISKLERAKIGEFADTPRGIAAVAWLSEARIDSSGYLPLGAIGVSRIFLILDLPMAATLLLDLALIVLVITLFTRWGARNYAEALAATKSDTQELSVPKDRLAKRERLRSERLMLTAMAVFVLGLASSYFHGKNERARESANPPIAAPAHRAESR